MLELALSNRPRPRLLAAALAVLLTLVLSCAPGKAAPDTPGDPDAFKEQREKMVRNDITRGGLGRKAVTDEATLRAMRTVPRHRFVPATMATNAYADRPLPIGKGQTISQPYIVASMTEALHVGPRDVVLEIGTGSGYQAAVLAEIVKEVYTIEIVKELGEGAAKILAELGYTNVHTRIGDGYIGWEEHAPYDAIIVTAAPDHIPQPLVDQLKPGGRMVIPVGPRFKTQNLMLVEKQEDGSATQRVLELVRFVPLTGNQGKDQP